MTKSNRVVSKRDRRIYEIACQYLVTIGGVTSNSIERYMNPTEYRTLGRLNKRLLESVRNTGMGPRVIPEATFERLATVLEGYSPRFIMAHYGEPEGWRRLLAAAEQVAPRPIRTTNRSLWPRFCRAIISGARFLAQFKSASDFYRWAREFESLDDRSKAALPLLIAAKVEGLGFPLACDFLKESGFTQFGKPDVRMKRMFTELDLCANDDDLEVFEAIARVAGNVGVTPYRVDKVFWLIASGKFYLDKRIKVSPHERQFIAHVRGTLGAVR